LSHGWSWERVTPQLGECQGPSVQSRHADDDDINLRPGALL
jgi:hypothetical protein